MARITVEDCIDKFESRFELVLVASNRARKLHSGDNPTVEKDNDKNTVIALREISEESMNIDELKNNLVEEYQTVMIQNEEELALEQEDQELNDNSAEEDIDKITASKDIDTKDETQSSDLIEENSLSLESKVEIEDQIENHEENLTEENSN